MLIFGWGATAMFDVYLSDRRVLLVVRKGFSIPLDDASSRWRKSKKRVISVSDEISLAPCGDQERIEFFHEAH